MTRINLKNLFVCLQSCRLAFSSNQPKRSELQCAQILEARNVKRGGELMSLDMFYWIQRALVWETLMRTITGGRSDTRSGSCSGSGRVFRIFGYSGIGIENPFGYFCTSGRVRVFLVRVRLF
ncbi:hypothetical protein Bca4012_043765 [Brassica carinata]